MEKYYYYDINVQIWEEESGEVFWSVIQSFSDEEDDIEVLGYGNVEDKGEAVKRAKECVLSVLG